VGTSFASRIFPLFGDYVFRLWTFLALCHFHGHLLTFLEGFESFHLDSAMMNKDILSTLALNESKTFIVVEPLDGSTDSFACHIYLKKKPSPATGD